MSAPSLRTNGLDGAPYIAFEPAPKRIEREHVAFVEANRARMSWQAMARACGVNQTDLRRRCDRAFAIVQGATAPAPEPKAPEPRSPIKALPPREFALAMKVLWTVAAGAAGLLDVSDACGISRGCAGQHVFRLKTEGLMAGHGRTGWVVTSAGSAALRKAAR